MIKKPRELSAYLKGKRVLIMAGELCNEIAFEEKGLLDYAVEMSNRLDAPVAATGNTAIPLREKGAKSVRKMWAAEVVNYLRWPWEKDKEHPPIMDDKPEVLLLIGYSSPVVESLASTVRQGDVETVALGSTYVESATYSLPASASLKQWEQSLREFVQSL